MITGQEISVIFYLYDDKLLSNSLDVEFVASKEDAHKVAARVINDSYNKFRGTAYEEDSKMKAVIADNLNRFEDVELSFEFATSDAFKSAWMTKAPALC